MVACSLFENGEKSGDNIVAGSVMADWPTVAKGTR